MSTLDGCASWPAEGVARSLTTVTAGRDTTPDTAGAVGALSPCSTMTTGVLAGLVVGLHLVNSGIYFDSPTTYVCNNILLRPLFKDFLRNAFPFENGGKTWFVWQLPSFHGLAFLELLASFAPVRP